jgi:transcriptional regulator with XRE-family HTH domain
MASEVRSVKTTKAYLSATEQAAVALGAQIAGARRELGWTQDQLAGRLGVSRQLVAKIEGGSTGATLGSVLEAAIVCGVQLFGVGRDDLPLVAERERARAALLPSRVRHQTPAISNDF